MCSFSKYHVCDTKCSKIKYWIVTFHFLHLLERLIRRSDVVVKFNLMLRFCRIVHWIIALVESVPSISFRISCTTFEKGTDKDCCNSKRTLWISHVKTAHIFDKFVLRFHYNVQVCWAYFTISIILGPAWSAFHHWLYVSVVTRFCLPKPKLKSTLTIL